MLGSGFTLYSLTKARMICYLKNKDWCCLLDIICPNDLKLGEKLLVEKFGFRFFWGLVYFFN